MLISFSHFLEDKSIKCMGSLEILKFIKKINDRTFQECMSLKGTKKIEIKQMQIESWQNHCIDESKKIQKNQFINKDDKIIEFKIDKKGRVFGIVDNDIFYVMIIDRNHEGFKTNS